MKILLTGSEGMVGKYLKAKLISKGYKIVEFDIKQGNDVCNLASVVKAGYECDVIVHLAALLGHDENESSEEISRVNLLGAFNILESAKENKVKKVINMSSVDSLGIFAGKGNPEYFPIDDNHPCKPTTAYAISKKLSEEICESFSKLHNIPIISLRPPGVWEDQFYIGITEARKRKPEIEYYPFWEYGAFIDVADLVDITIKCIEVDFRGYMCCLVASNDMQSTGYTAMELANKLLPEVKIKNAKRYEDDPYASLIDCSTLEEKFNWKPKRSWRNFLKRINS